jgi:Protein of unknown function (DUF3306)
MNHASKDKKVSRETEAPGFLKRWSERKQLVAKEALVVEEQQQQPQVQAPAELDGENLPLPSLDDILPGSDMSVFFQKHVPEALRAAALRKLWITDPDIKDFIEMADYQWDFTKPDSIPGWSSTVEGVDMKAMLDKIFNGAIKKEPEPLDEAPQSEPPEDENTTPNDRLERNEMTVSEAISEPSPPLETLVSTASLENGAVQKTTGESSVYDVIPKRHGGALPT